MTKLSSVIHLPLLWSFFICVAIITPYIIAVSLHHVYPFLPTISLTAAFEPEGSIFGFLMSFVAFFGLLTICSRYFHLAEVQSNFEQNILRKVKWFNKACFSYHLVYCVFLLLFWWRTSESLWIR